jgi:hypothetical protein
MEMLVTVVRSMVGPQLEMTKPGESVARSTVTQSLRIMYEKTPSITHQQFCTQYLVQKQLSLRGVSIVSGPRHWSHAPCGGHPRMEPQVQQSSFLAWYWG